MVKHFVLLIIVSIIAVFFRTEVSYVIHGLLMVHDKIVHGLGVVFSGGQWGQLIELSFTLFIIPVVIGLIVMGIYWLIKRTQLPRMMELIWIVWVILLTALALQGS
ncbi:MAG: hypothetical protein P1U40_06610 [Coxiellaceae bacterium]|nr:hypothetical protein [Coxiellaceae bacterium]